MTQQENLSTPHGALASRTIAAPHASDSLAAVFRTAFAASGDLPDDFRVMLARIDRDATDTR